MASDESHLPRSAAPTLRQLQFLAALHAHGGFVRAADAIGVTQPTLSAGMKELEAILGVALVDRSRPGANLTAAGEDAAARASQILSEVEDLVRAVRGQDAPMTGPLRVGAIPTIAPFLLPRAFAALRARYPLLRLVVREDVTARLVESLRARSLDAAIIALPYEAKGIETETIAEDEFLLAAPPNHRLAAKPHLAPDDLTGEELLLLEDGHCMRDHALSLCRLEAPRRAADLGATSLFTLVQMVAGGLGVTLVPRLAAEGGAAAGANVVLRSFEAPVTGRSLAVAWRAGGPRARDGRALAQTLRGLFSAATGSASPAG
jgi:LysR family hydrogen peroxide-inducible transcriptional activator